MIVAGSPSAVTRMWPTSRLSPRRFGAPSAAWSCPNAATVSTNMPGSGSNARSTPAAVAVFDEAADRVAEAHERLAGRHRVRPRARPERDAVGAEVGGDLDRYAQESFPERAAGIEEARPVLLARVEEEARAALDDHAEVERRELLLQRRGPAPEVRREGIEVVDVEGQRDRAVAEPGEDLDRVLEPMAREPARRVSDPEHRSTIPRSSAGPRSGSSAESLRLESRRVATRLRAAPRGRRSPRGSARRSDRAGAAR